MSDCTVTTRNGIVKKMPRKKQVRMDRAEVIASKEALEYFWTQVNRDGDCWLWTGNRLQASLGYGRFYFAGQTFKAHRFSYMANVGPIDDSLCVCHKCDNPICVRPEHLFKGTHKDNGEDKANKGRSTIGDRNYFHGKRFAGEENRNAKLTEDKVRNIRAMLSSGATRKAASAAFGVHYNTVAMIHRGEIWSHVV